MKQKWLRQAIIDGLLNTISYIVLEWFVVSIFFDRFISDDKSFLFICLLGPIINSIIYYKFLSKKESVKELLFLTFVSALIFIVCMMIRLVCMVTQIFTFTLFQRELGNGDGILILFIAFIFLASTIVFRLFILVYEIVRICMKKSKE